MAIDNAPTNPHSPGPWRWHYGQSTKLLSALGRPVIGIGMGSNGQPTLVTNTADAALIAQAPALLQAAEKTLVWMFGEREAVYEGARDRDGNIPHQEDRDTLAAIDADIAELQALIAACEGAA